MADFIVFDNTTGEIIRSGTCPDDMVTIQAIESDESVIDSTGITLIDIESEYYVDTTSEILIEKDDFPGSIDSTSIIANGVDTITVSDIPNSSTLYLLSSIEEYIITDGSLVLTTKRTGTIYLEFIVNDSVIYKKGEFEINAS